MARHVYRWSKWVEHVCKLVFGLPMNHVCCWNGNHAETTVDNQHVVLLKFYAYEKPCDKKVRKKNSK